jgi:hypothetical protein
LTVFQRLLSARPQHLLRSLHLKPIVRKSRNNWPSSSGVHQIYTQLPWIKSFRALHSEIRGETGQSLHPASQGRKAQPLDIGNGDFVPKREIKSRTNCVKEFCFGFQVVV